MALTQSEINGLGSIFGDWHFNDLSTLTVDASDNISDAADQSSAGNNLSNATVSEQAQYTTGVFRGIGGAEFGHNSQENFYQLSYPGHLTGTVVVVVQMDNAAATDRDLGAALIDTVASHTNRRAFQLRRDVAAGDRVSFFTDASGWIDSRQVFGNSQIGVFAWQQSNSNIRVTFNGVEIINQALSAQSSSVDTFTLGTALPGGNQWFDGVMFRATVYTDVLSDSNLSLLVNSHLETYFNPVKPSVPSVDSSHFLASNIAAAYLFNEGSGAQLTDASDNNRHGVLGKNIGSPISTVTAETGANGLCTDGTTVFETTNLVLFGRTSSNQLNDDAPIQGSPNRNGDCAYFSDDDEVYVAMSTLITPVAANAQIAICTAEDAQTQRIIDLSVNGPFDPSGCYVESDGAGGVDVYVSSYDPAQGFTANGLYHYNSDASNVVTFVGTVSFQVNLPFIQGVTRDSSGNWLFTVWNEDDEDRNWLFKFDSSRNLIGARYLPKATYFEVKGIDATQTNLHLGYRVNVASAAAYQTFNQSTLFDITGAPWDGERLNFDNSDADNWFAAIPILLGSTGTIVAKFDPVSIFDNNQYIGSLNNENDWEGFTDLNTGSETDGGQSSFRLDANTRLTQQQGFGERILSYTYDLAGNEIIYNNGIQSESGAVAGGAPSHLGMLILGGLSNTDSRSDSNYDLLVVFDRVLSFSEVEVIASSGDPFDLFQDEVTVSISGEIQSQNATFEGSLIISSDLSGEIQSEDATFEGTLTIGAIISGDIQSGNATFEGTLTTITGTFEISGEIQSGNASLAGNIEATGVIIPGPESSLQLRLDRYVDIDSAE